MVHNWRRCLCAALLAVVIVVATGSDGMNECDGGIGIGSNNDAEPITLDSRRLLVKENLLRVFSPMSSSSNQQQQNDAKGALVARARSRKQRAVLTEVFSGSTVDVQYVRNTTEQQNQFLVNSGCVKDAASRHETFVKENMPDLAVELWKWCSLYQFGGIFLDAQATILNGPALKRLIQDDNDPKSGIVIVNSQSATPLMIRHAQSPIAANMAQLLVETSLNQLIANPLIVGETLYNFTTSEQDKWHILQQSCSCTNGQPGICCITYSGTDIASERVALLGSNEEPMTTTISVLPIKETKKAFESTVTQVTTPTKSPSSSSNNNNQKTFYQILEAANCMPTTACHKCLSDKKHGATCESCRDDCPCFCKELCHHQKETKHTAENTFLVTPPLRRKDPTRLIPRIVHQTWFEDIATTNAHKYPHLSRFVNSYQHSGWQYKFYTDDDAAVFLSNHFPPQVRQAYDLLIPGAFKADLFRYCVLLIEGGVYSDVDTLLGPSLDHAIQNNVGFLVGLDEPGKRIGTRMCLWNGFLAAAPGHPFLAAVIETVVNNIHQRFTSLDVAQLHCPSPELSTIASYSSLFVAGPCILGSTINHVLGRYRQTPFESGELLPMTDTGDHDANNKQQQHHNNATIPGRTLLLSQNKLDMGAHRFTLEELNLIVLSTDFPESDDREKLDDYVHYSETRIKFTTYGVEGVYKDNHRNMSALIRLTVGPAK